MKKEIIAVDLSQGKAIELQVEQQFFLGDKEVSEEQFRRETRGFQQIPATWIEKGGQRWIQLL